MLPTVMQKLLHACKGSANREKCKINYDLFSFPRCSLPSPAEKVRISERYARLMTGITHTCPMLKGMVCVWHVYGMCMVCVWYVYGMCMVCIWHVYGMYLSEACLKRCKGTSPFSLSESREVIFLWKSFGVSEIFRNSGRNCRISLYKGSLGD